MQPTIKLRAWDKETQSWLKAVTYTLHTSGRLLVTPPHVELTLWTGLVDRLGNDIYVGDIVQCDTFEGSPRGIVTWLKAAAGCTILAADGTVAYALSDAWEVIGNIYETPALLEMMLGVFAQPVASTSAQRVIITKKPEKLWE